MKPFWITLSAGWLMVVGVVYHAEHRWDALHQKIYQPRALTPDELWVRPRGFLDEHELRLRQLAQDERTLDSLIFGNSRAFTVSSDLFKPGAAVRNLSVGRASLPELTALWQDCLQHGRHPGPVLIFLDPVMFQGKTGPFVNSPEISPAPHPATPLTTSFWVQLYQLRGLMSWDGFQTGMETLLRRHADPLSGIIPRKNWRQEGIAYAFDGSLLRPPAGLPARSVIISALDTLDHSPDALGFESFSSQGENLMLFKTWLNQIRANGGQAYLVLAPYHPAVYRRLQERHLAAVQLFSRSLENAARENHAVFCDAMNPALSACGAGDFRDEIHAEPGCVGRVVSRCLARRGMR